MVSGKSRIFNPEGFGKVTGGKAKETPPELNPHHTHPGGSAGIGYGKRFHPQQLRHLPAVFGPVFLIFLGVVSIASAQEPPSEYHFKNVAQDGQGVGGVVSLTPTSKQSARATELVFLSHGWTPDTGDNIWAVLSEKGNVLSQWDGSQWHEHPFPDAIRDLRFLGAGVDTRGRIWLLPNGGQTAFSNRIPASGAFFRTLKPRSRN